MNFMLFVDDFYGLLVDILTLHIKINLPCKIRDSLFSAHKISKGFK